MINKIINKTKTNIIMTKNELIQTQGFIMKESICLTYMDGLDNDKLPLLTQTQTKKEDHNYIVNIQDSINPDIIGVGAFLKIGKVAPSVFNSSKTILNKGIATYDAEGRQTSIFINSTVKPSVFSGLKHNKDTVVTIKNSVTSTYYNVTFGTMNQFNKIAPNTTNKYLTNSSKVRSNTDDFINSAIPGITISNKTGTLGWAATATTVYLESTKADIENGVKLIKSIPEKIKNLFEKENNDK